MAIELIGSEARGKAGVFGTATNPLAIYLQHQAGRQKRDADLYEQARTHRNKVVDDLLKHSPDKAWEPMQFEVEQLANQIRQKTMAQLDAGEPISKIQSDAARMWGQHDIEVARSNEYKRQWLNLEEQVKKDPELIQGNGPDSASEGLRSYLYRDDNPMQARFMGEIDLDAAADEAFNNPKRYNKPAVYSRFMGDLPALISSNEQAYMAELGQQFDLTKVESKLGLRLKDQNNPNAGYWMDPRTNKPMVSLTDAVLDMAIQDPKIANIVRGAVPDGDREKVRDFLAQEMGVYNPVKIENSTQLGFKYDKEERDKDLFTNWGITFGTKVNDLEARRDWLEKVTTKKSPELLSAISNAIGDVKLEYVKGGSSFSTAPGQSPTKGEGESIRIHYPTGTMAMNADEKVYVDRLFGGPGKRKDFIDVPIGTDEKNRKAELMLSNIIDKLNPKQSIGADDYVKYTEAWRKNKKKGTFNDIGSTQGGGAFDNY